ncbi:hypothetical protein [Priestia megaterium]|uniref:hypothetical protein n=1 Tax=Priestia megaterium TaxID=1404 RepID=UPI000BFC4E2C|nr:hypothetical protein [Priestia megaterium]MDC7769170.1 hypothetical protein [Priestia megaterium]PGR06070.1 hypothetical protein COA23_13880 [Priestia megaterium]UYT86744.1 hypothetical protein OHU75_04115 [Priestia megaterium]
MVKNLPLLMAILLIGISFSLISGSVNLSGSIEWIFLIISLIANITAVIGHSLHVFVYLPVKKAEKNLKETFK